MGKVFVAILGVFLLLGVFATSINTGIKGWRTVDTTESAVVTTAAGITTANVTLTGDLFQNNITEVISITSNVTGEEPVATSYASSTNRLLVSALDANTSHRLTLNYYAESENTVLRVIGPFLALLIFGGLLAALVMGVLKKGHR